MKAKIAEQIDSNLSVMEQAEIDALPDPMIGLSEMREYGYTWNEMLPLTQEKALELFDHDLPSPLGQCWQWKKLYGSLCGE